jgi:hypothetical protein
MPDPPFSVGVPIPDILFKPLETALKTKIRSLVKDIAHTLGQPEDPLLAALLKGSTVSPYIVEESDEKDNDARCNFKCTHPESPAILQECGEPILWSSRPGPSRRRCAAHAFASVKPPGPIQVLRRLDIEDETLVRGEDGTVFDGEGKAVGCLHGTRLVRLKVKEDTQ